MGSIGPSMKLKLKRDTFVLPNGQGGVYFRNNQGSFEMEGRAIHQWMEKLLPVFDGQHAIGDLIDGLPEAYQDRILEIAEVLYRNGFVRDTSTDKPHSLSSDVLHYYAGQIEFLDNVAASGAFRFEQYRQTRILVLGNHPLVSSAVSALLESGIPVIHVGVPMGEAGIRNRIKEIADRHRTFDTDVEVSVAEFVMGETTYWDEITREYDVVLYASVGDTERLLKVEETCRRTGKTFVPILFVQGAAVIGPILEPASKIGWNSAWHRLHRAAIPQTEGLPESFVGESLALNIAVFHLFKTMTTCYRESPEGRFYVLNLETLEGAWHSCLQHPIETGLASVSPILDGVKRLEASLCNTETNTEMAHDTPVFLPLFAELTNPVCGIFHTWDEGELEQLPLSVCSVQVADGLSEGPANLLPAQIGAGLTHEEARREAGLLGIEAYVERLLQPWLTGHDTPNTDGTDTPNVDGTDTPNTDDTDGAGFGGRDGCGHGGTDDASCVGSYGIGSGGTFAESLWRALHRAMVRDLTHRVESEEPPRITRIDLRDVEDNTCNFYMRVLEALKVKPMIGIGENLYGLPVVWIGDSGRFFAGIGLSQAMALREALQTFILHKTALAGPNHMGYVPCVQATSITVAESKSLGVAVPSISQLPGAAEVKSALHLLSSSGVEYSVWDATVDPFLKTIPGGVVAIRLRQGDSQ